MAGPTTDNTQIFTSSDINAVKVADDVVTYSGEEVKVQHIGLVESVGSEGSRTLRKYSALDVLITAGNAVLNSINSILNTISATQLPATKTQNAGALRTGSSEVVITLSVPVGQQASNAVDLGGLRNWALFVPSTFDGTQIQFNASDTLGGVYSGVFDITNTRVTLAAGTNRWHDIPGELMAFRFVQLVTVSTQTTTATDFILVGKT